MAVLGTVGFRYIGVYDATKEYVTGNVVTYDGSSYVMIKYASDGVSKTAVTGVAPDADDTTWKIMAEGISESKADAKLKEAVSTAEASAKKWAVGNDESITEGSDTDNAKAYAEQAKEAAEKASAVSGVGIATATKAGIVKVDDDTIKVDADGTIHGASKVPVATTEAVGTVKPDGDTITIDEDGTIHGVSKITVDDALSDTSENPVQNKAIKAAINELLAGIGEGRERLDGLDDLTDILTHHGAGLHNALYRGKYLGDSLTAAQSAAIRAGTFEDLYIGDYWTINGVNYRIADFDYFYRAGDTECTTHHAVIVPDTDLDNQKMNDTNVTTGGYAGSKMHTDYMATAKNKIIAAFGSGHILNHRELLTNAVANGRPSGEAWFDSTIELMSEAMCYGGTFFEPVSDGSTVPDKYSVAYKQLNLFRHRPDMISNRQTFWLRNVVSAAYFALVATYGYAACGNASNSNGVRPAFPIY